MSDDDHRLPFEVMNATPEMRESLDKFGEAVTRVRKMIKWDETDVPEGHPEIFHCEHCHVEMDGRGNVLCFGALYFFDNGERILCYTDSRAGGLQMIGQPDQIKEAFSWMVAFGLVSPHMSRHVPDAPRNKIKMN